MKFITFLTKYEHSNYDINNYQTAEFNRDWDNVKDKYKENIPTIRLLLEQMIEKKFPTFLIKELFNLHSDKDEIKKNEDLFKWAAAFHSRELINFLYLNMDVKNEQGAVNAAIINFRLDNLQALNDLGINVFSEKHFGQAIGRSHQPQKPDIIEYYLENRDKFTISDYGKKALKEHTRLIEWVIQKEDFEKVKFLLECGVGANKRELLRQVCTNGKLNSVKYILNTNDFDNLADNEKITKKDIDDCVVWAANCSYDDIVNYFVIEKEVKLSKTIKQGIKNYNLEDLEQIFKIRDRKNELNKELPTQEVVVFKPKLKL